MNTIAVLIFCIQACLVQTVLCQCTGNAYISSPAYVAPAHGYGVSESASALIGSRGYPGTLGNGALAVPDEAAYGGIGEANVAVIGELPVVGHTAVIGQVPILGAVYFGGDVQACGSVSINGRCSCGCE